MSVSAISETVWLKDVTKRIHGEKRTLDDFDLPDQLTFQLRRETEALNLNLKRNYDIDPNAEIYVGRKLKDGRSVLLKTQNMKKENSMKLIARPGSWTQDLTNPITFLNKCSQLCLLSPALFIKYYDIICSSKS
ncbi:hypothetical protein CHS0354_018591 [Potamilus streckersoni]|uniref:Uncharacterized protein n=1 Tax=Potamilus streckersoni TaxID=2493646 RepID=A0AAE0TF13_9BIVA|nr:hypothetical protein CHS0354_018591 [Potamilus streckersoni]